MNLRSDFINNANVEDYIPIINPKEKKQHDGTIEREGICALCKSCRNAKHTVTININTNKFFCRCLRKGGYVIDALALSEGIIPCSALKVPIKERYNYSEKTAIYQAIRDEKSRGKF